MAVPRRIFCGGLPKKLGEGAFREYFEKFGELIDVELMQRPGDNRNRGFGFVKYSDVETSEKVISMHHILEGQKLTVNYAKVPLPRDTRRFFIGSINKDAICEQDLSTYFSQYGVVEDVVIMKEKNFGFVALHNSNHSKLDSVLNDTHTINGETLQLEPAKPKPNRNRDMGPGGMPDHRFGGPQRFNPYGGPMGGPWGPPPPFGPYGHHHPYGPPPPHAMRNPEYETYEVKQSAWKPPSSAHGGRGGPPRGPDNRSQYNPHRDAPASTGGGPYGTGSGFVPPGGAPYGNYPPPSHSAPPAAGSGPNSYTSYGAPPSYSGATGAPTSGFGGPSYNPYSQQPTQAPTNNTYQAPPPSTGAPTSQPYQPPPAQTNYPAPSGYGQQPQARPTGNTYTTYTNPPAYQ